MVILDNGHGANTKGKCSPVWGNGTQLLEWEFNRDIVNRICKQLDILGLAFTKLVPEETDISLRERCIRANKIYADNKEAFLLSIHANAGGGSGWECYTTIGHTASDRIATIISEQAKAMFPNKKMRFDYSDKDPDKESQFYILKNTHCPAVLTENFFMDNENECKFLMSDIGRECIAKMHVLAIKNILK